VLSCSPLHPSISNISRCYASERVCVFDQFGKFGCSNFPFMYVMIMYLGLSTVHQYIILSVCLFRRKGWRLPMWCRASLKTVSRWNRM